MGWTAKFCGFPKAVPFQQFFNRRHALAFRR
jgi:hypothetical protein